MNQTICKLQKLDKNQTKIRQKLEEISILRKLEEIRTSKFADVCHGNTAKGSVIKRPHLSDQQHFLETPAEKVIINIHITLIIYTYTLYWLYQLLEIDWSYQTLGIAWSVASTVICIAL